MAIESPWIRMSVDIFNHPLFEGEPYSKRDAWMWLIAHAQRSTKVVSLGRGKSVTLEAGDVLAARKFLGAKWGWTEQKVRCFLLKLRTHGALELRRTYDRCPSVVTICNYDEYQVAFQQQNPKRTRKGPEKEPDSYNNKKIYIYTPPEPGVSADAEASLSDALEAPFDAEAHRRPAPVVLPAEGVSGPDAEPIGAAAPAAAELPLGDVPDAKKTPAAVREAFEAYNAVAARCGLPKASKLSSARATKIRARLKDYGLDGWKRALANIEASAFLRGQTRHAFRADLDFVCRPDRFERLHDGGYGNGAHATPQGRPGGTSTQVFLDTMPDELDGPQLRQWFSRYVAETEDGKELLRQHGPEKALDSFEFVWRRRVEKKLADERRMATVVDGAFAL